MTAVMDLYLSCIKYRFLNRMEEVKCFSESLAFLMFLSRPESTLDLGKKEVESNINQRTDEDIAEELIHVFPHLRKQQLSDNAQNEDIPRLREFLQKLEMQMCVVNKSAMKLFHNLNSVALEMNGFHKAFDSLYVAEGNYPYKTNEHRLDVRKQFRGIFTLHLHSFLYYFYFTFIFISILHYFYFILFCFVFVFKTGQNSRPNKQTHTMITSSVS